jgi:hypothetical protein
MASEFPQLAFQQWLRDALESLSSAIRDDDEERGQLLPTNW